MTPEAIWTTILHHELPCGMFDPYARLSDAMTLLTTIPAGYTLAIRYDTMTTKWRCTWQSGEGTAATTDVVGTDYADTVTRAIVVFHQQVIGATEIRRYV